MQSAVILSGYYYIGEVYWHLTTETAEVSSRQVHIFYTKTIKNGIYLGCTTPAGCLQVYIYDKKITMTSFFPSGSQTSENWNIVTFITGFILAIRSFNFY